MSKQAEKIFHYFGVNYYDNGIDDNDDKNRIGQCVLNSDASLSFLGQYMYSGCVSVKIFLMFFW